MQPEVLAALTTDIDSETFVLGVALATVLEPAKELAETIGEYLERMYNDGYATCSEEMSVEQMASEFQIPADLEQDILTVLVEDAENLTYRIDLIARTTGMQALNDGRLDAIADANAALRSGTQSSTKRTGAATAAMQGETQVTGRRFGKKWNAMMDDDTRFTHYLLNGTVVEADGWFETVNGRAQRPGGFGIPEEDCNCRCVIDPVEMED